MTTLTNFDKVQARLRRANRGRYALLLFCSFFSVTLVTAYSLMMRSPTVMDVLPEGGDSRKQIMMVFVLTILGCAVLPVFSSGKRAARQAFSSPSAPAAEPCSARFTESLRSSR